MFFWVSPRTTLRVSRKQNSLFPLGPVIKAWVKRRTSHEPNKMAKDKRPNSWNNDLDSKTIEAAYNTKQK